MSDHIHMAARTSERMQCAEAFHVAEYIEDEMTARGWDRDELATRMLPPEQLDPLDHDAWGIARLALDMLLDVRRTDVALGEQAEQLARAFGTSAEFWRNLHEAWRTHPTVSAPPAGGAGAG